MKIFTLMLIGFLSACGSSKNSDQNLQPSEQISDGISQDRKVTVQFSPLSLHLADIERYKLWDTFKGIKDEDKGYWTIIGHSFDPYFSLHRARHVEYFLRHKMHYDVVGKIEGRNDADWGNVEVTFSYYKDKE